MAQLPPGWQQYTTPQGRPYYYDTYTNISYWEVPPRPPSTTLSPQPTLSYGPHHPHSPYAPYNNTAPNVAQIRPHGQLLYHQSYRQPLPQQENLYHPAGYPINGGMLSTTSPSPGMSYPYSTALTSNVSIPPNAPSAIAPAAQPHSQYPFNQHHHHHSATPNASMVQSPGGGQQQQQYSPQGQYSQQQPQPQQQADASSSPHISNVEASEQEKRKTAFLQHQKLFLQQVQDGLLPPGELWNRNFTFGDGSGNGNRNESGGEGGGGDNRVGLAGTPIGTSQDSSEMLMVPSTQQARQGQEQGREQGQRPKVEGSRNEVLSSSAARASRIPSTSSPVTIRSDLQSQRPPNDSSASTEPNSSTTSISKEPMDARLPRASSFPERPPTPTAPSLPDTPTTSNDNDSASNFVEKTTSPEEEPVAVSAVGDSLSNLNIGSAAADDDDDNNNDINSVTASSSTTCRSDLPAISSSRSSSSDQGERQQA